MHKCQVVEALANYPDCESRVTRQYDMDGRFYCDLHYRHVVWVYDRKDILISGYGDAEVQWGPYSGLQQNKEDGA